MRTGEEVEECVAWAVCVGSEFFLNKSILLEPEVPLPLFAVRKREERRQDRASDKSLDLKLKLDRFIVEHLLETDQHKILR